MFGPLRKSSTNSIKMFASQRQDCELILSSNIEHNLQQIYLKLNSPISPRKYFHNNQHYRHNNENEHDNDSEINLSDTSNSLIRDLEEEDKFVCLAAPTPIRSFDSFSISKICNWLGPMPASLENDVDTEFSEKISSSGRRSQCNKNEDAHPNFYRSAS